MAAILIMIVAMLIIDTNWVEGEIRNIALGKKNWMCVSRRRIHDEILKAA